MSDRDMNALLSQPLDRSLDGLEAKVWAGVAAHEKDQRTCQVAVSFQACVLAIAIVVGGMAGVSAAYSQQDPSTNGFTSDEHAPSHLLLGVPR